MALRAMGDQLMGLQVLAPKAVRRIERALNPPRPFSCPHREAVEGPARGYLGGMPHLPIGVQRTWGAVHKLPPIVKVARGAARGGYTYLFTVAAPARLDGHYHGWMDLKLWRAHVQYWWDVPNEDRYTCEYMLALPQMWHALGVWGVFDGGVTHWSSCNELFPKTEEPS